MIPRDLKEAKEMPLKFLRNVFEKFYPNTTERKKDYVKTSKSLRKMLKAWNSIR